MYNLKVVTDASPDYHDQEYRCFNPNGLKYRDYYNNWDRGHRYILNLRANESYTRYYSSLGESRPFYVPNHGDDPEVPNRRYRIRGNGIWTFHPQLNANGLKALHGVSACVATEPFGVLPEEAGKIGTVVFKIQGTNVIASMSIKAVVLRATEADLNALSVSTTNGLTWTTVWTNDKLGESTADVKLVDEVNGAYEVLVRVSLMGSRKPEDARLKDIAFQTITMLNSKTQPKLLLGRNTVHVGIGDPFAVQKLLGHADVKMASTYVQNISEQTDRVTNDSRKVLVQGSD